MNKKVETKYKNALYFTYGASLVALLLFTYYKSIKKIDMVEKNE